MQKVPIDVKLSGCSSIEKLIRITTIFPRILHMNLQSATQLTSADLTRLGLERVDRLTAPSNFDESWVQVRETKLNEIEFFFIYFWFRCLLSFHLRRIFELCYFTEVLG